MVHVSTCVAGVVIFLVCLWFFSKLKFVPRRD